MRRNIGYSVIVNHTPSLTNVHSIDMVGGADGEIFVETVSVVWEERNAPLRGVTWQTSFDKLSLFYTTISYK